MSEIEVGQERVDAKGFTWRVVSFGGTVRIERTDGRAGRTVSLSTVRKMALYPRSIRLPLAKDTTESHCGGCCGLLETDRGDICGRFKGVLPAYDADADDYQRLPECVAAEK